MPGRLSDLQDRILRVTRSVEPPWSLTGGGALAGFHLRHRATRDLDLFWHGLSALGEVPREIEQRLRADGLEVSTVSRAPSFHRFQVASPHDTCVVDLVADTSVILEPPVRTESSATGPLLVDTPYEIFVNKLCALLGRSEIRDLVDLKALLETGLDLERALSDANRKDAGFSPLVLAWVLRSLPLAVLAGRSGLSSAEAEELAGFRDQLVSRLIGEPPP